LILTTDEASQFINERRDKRAKDYEKILLSVQSPNIKPYVEKTYSYSPDFAPTVLEILGFKINEFNLGKSILSKRKNYQTLIAPDFIISNGIKKMGGHCKLYNKSITASNSDFIINDCKRLKIFQYYHEQMRISQFKSDRKNIFKH